MNYKTYLFDFDYTLADSSRGIVKCFRIVLTCFEALFVSLIKIKLCKCNLLLNVR